MLCASKPCVLSVERQVRQIPFRAARSRDAFGVARGLSRIWVEQHRQPGNGPFVKFPFAAHITDPGRKVGNHNQFLSQPGEIGDMPNVHHASRAFTTRE